MPNHSISLRPVQYVIGPSIAYVELTQGQFACIDLADAELVGQRNWFAEWSKYLSAFYASTNVPIGGGKYRVLRMHRLVLGAVQSHTDHASGRTLDNRRANLRTSNATESARNRGLRSDSSTRATGVHRDKRTGRFFAHITVGGKSMRLGTRKTFDEARRLRLEAELKHYGAFAPTLRT